MKRLAYFLFIFSVLTSAAPLVYADEATVNGVSYEKFERDLPVSVRALDNSDVNIELQKIFEEVLRQQGFTVLANAGLILSFDTKNEEGAWSDAGNRQLIELKNQDGTPHSNSPEVRMNLFNSNRGGVLNSGTPGTTEVTPTYYRLDITLENSANGQRLWEGWATAELGLADEITLSKAMVPLLLKNLGKNINQKKFNLF